VVVLAVRFDCRSRQAAFGLCGVDSSTALRSSSPRASGRRAKARRKPAQRRQSCGYGGGSRWALRKQVSRGTCRGKALRAAELTRFDERVEEAALALRRARETGRARGATRGVRGCSSVAHAVDNAAARCSCSGGSRALSRAPGTCQPKLEARRQAVSTGGRLAARRVGAGLRARARGSVGASKGVRSGVERSVGARVFSGLQKSVRSIFPFRSGRGREAGPCQRTGSTTRRFFGDRKDTSVSGERVRGWGP
jgi:hypothetical protein